MSGNPLSASNYQYQSLAVPKENLANVYRKDNTNTFFSFIIVLPFLAIIAFFIIIVSNHDSIEEKMKKKEQHKNFAAVICLGLNIAAYVTTLDIWALCWFTDKEHGGKAIYFSTEDTEYEEFKHILIAHVVAELPICVAGEFCLIILACTHCCHERNKLIKPWCTHLLLFIPPIWCLASHFGFIVIAWSSFVRRGKALTLVYVIGATAMFIVMRQTYKLIDKRPRGSNNLQEDGISFLIILVVHVVGFILVGVFFYIMYGLWLVPASETVEDSPVYLSHSLHLIIVVLAVLVSYKISFGDDEVVELLKEIRDRQPLRNEDPIASPSNGNESPGQPLGDEDTTPSPSCNTRVKSRIQENDETVVQELEGGDEETLTMRSRHSCSTKETRTSENSSGDVGETDMDKLIENKPPV